MAPISTAYDHIRSNNIKTLLLILAFPATLALILYGILYLAVMNDPAAVQVASDMFLQVAMPVIVIAFIWTGISYWFGDKMMLGFAGAHLAPDDKTKKTKRFTERSKTSRWQRGCRRRKSILSKMNP